jgi:protein-S-isoprenylcysteine O-methyltransferase Ste14
MIQILVVTVLEITGIFMAFAFVHSLCLQDSVKEFVRITIGEGFVKYFYRLFYTFFSALTTAAAFAFIYSLADRVLFKGPALFRWLMHMVQLSGLLLAMLTFKVLDFREFLGFRQAWRYVKREAPQGNSEGLTVERLITNGAYGLVRHPLYLAGIIIFTFEPNITRNWLTVAILTDAYFIYGAIAEEKRLTERFGVEYVHYTQRVPMLIPGLKPRNKKTG